MKTSVKVQFFGDVCFNKLPENQINKVLADVCDKVSNADLRIINLECPITENKEETAIEKTGEHWNATVAIIDFIKALNVDIVTLANNHVGDYGTEGVRNTICKLNAASKKYIGAGENIDEAYNAFYYDGNGIRVSFIAVCEKEFGVASKKTAGSAGFSIRNIFNKIKEEKKRSDHVVVIMHGGNEGNPLPSPEQVERYRFLIDVGASVVVGMHTHCPQGYELYNKGIILYSLGNFFFPYYERFNNSYAAWYTGYIAELLISESGIEVNTIPYQYSFAEEKIKICDAKSTASFKRYLEKLNKIVADEEELKRYYAAWTLHIGKKYADRVYWCKEFSDERKQKQCLEIQNLFRCEAHREMMQNYFEILSQKKEQEYEEYWTKLKELFFIPLEMHDWKEEMDAIYEYVNLVKQAELLEFVARDGKNFICGAGKCGITIYKKLRDNNYKVERFYDNNEQKEGTFICDTPIEMYGRLISCHEKLSKYIIAVIEKKNQEKIVQQLLALGVQKEQIFIGG